MTTTRTIEQILQIRLRAAELRVLERGVALAKNHEALRSALITTDLEAEQAKLVEAKQLAVDALTLVRQEIAAQKGEIDPLPYESGAGFANRRYAAVLMLDDPELSVEEAMAQAGRDDAARLEEYLARVHGDELDEDETTEE
jgi:hypothetical protein